MPTQHIKKLVKRQKPKIQHKQSELLRKEKEIKRKLATKYAKAFIKGELEYAKNNIKKAVNKVSKKLSIKEKIQKKRREALNKIIFFDALGFLRENPLLVFPNLTQKEINDLVHLNEVRGKISDKKDITMNNAASAINKRLKRINKISAEEIKNTAKDFIKQNLQKKEQNENYNTNDMDESSDNHFISNNFMLYLPNFNPYNNSLESSEEEPNDDDKKSKEKKVSSKNKEDNENEEEGEETEESEEENEEDEEEEDEEEEEENTDDYNNFATIFDILSKRNKNSDYFSFSKNESIPTVRSFKQRTITPLFSHGFKTKKSWFSNSQENENIDEGSEESSEYETSD